jgi:hypothetical protein
MLLLHGLLALQKEFPHKASAYMVHSCAVLWFSLVQFVQVLHIPSLYLV